MDGRQGRRATGRQHLYVRHKPEETPLYAIIEQHAPRFFAKLSEQGASLLSFVQAEFEHYLRCGRLEEGFLRVKCSQCRHERLVAHVFPRVPVRQWVLSFQRPLRLLFAARPDVLTRVLNVVTRALSTAVLKGAGLSRSAGAQSGIVTSIQRFGSALNLNVYLHLLVLDGGYTFAHDRAQFHRAPAPSQVELERVLDTLIARITRTLVAAPGILPPAAFVLPCTSAPASWSKIPSTRGLTWSRAA